MASGGEVTKVRDELIGPSLGDELRSKALIALGVALAAQLLYLAVRFRWTFGGAAVLAMPTTSSSWSACSPGWASRSTASSSPPC